MKSLSITNFPAPGYMTSEAVNTLCTNLTFSGENVKKIMFTSCIAAEGKSFTSMNVMRTLARNGRSVALVDCDLRRSMIVSRFGLTSPEGENLVGITHYLAGKAGMEEVIYQTDIPGAYIVPVGRRVNSPLPLLNSQRFSDLLDFLASRVDYVICDAPPLGVVIDGAEVAKSVDASVIVVSYNKVKRQMLQNVAEQIQATGCPILGTVLNQVDMNDLMSRKYYYKANYYTSGNYYYYTTDEESGQKKKKRRSSAE